MSLLLLILSFLFGIPIGIGSPGVPADAPDTVRPIVAPAADAAPPPVAEPAAVAAAAADAAPAMLLPDLVDRLTEVQTVQVVTDRYDMTFTLAGNDWISADFFDYPARTDAFSYLFLDLSFLVEFNLLPNDPATYAGFGVADPGAEGGGSRITVSTASGETIVDLIVGRPEEAAEGARGGVYIRRLDTGELWLAAGQATVPVYPSEWFDPVVDYRIGAIAQVEILRGETPILTADKIDATEFTLAFADPAVAPAGAIANSRALRVLSQGIASTMFDAVRPVEGLTVPADARTIRFAMTSGLELSVTLVPADGETWVIYAASAPPGSAAVAEAVTLSTRVDGWAFRLPDSRITLLDVDPATLVTAP
ncbi:MAG: hypothetical protein AB7O56_15260 [Bauldia sp.]